MHERDNVPNTTSAVFSEAPASADQLDTQITELRRANNILRVEVERLRRSEQDLVEVLENAPVGVHCVGSDGIVLRANRTELKLLGYAAEEYIGHHIAEFYADEHVIADILRRLQAGEELHGYEARLLCKDGSIRTVLISSNVHREDGRFVHTRCFTRDITGRKAMEDSLRAADTRKDDFIATLAHELRNPLAPISNSLEVLRFAEKDGALLAKTRGIMQRQLQHLVRLVDDLLDVSRITHDKLELRKDRVELTTVVETALETSKPLIEKAGHELTIMLPPHPVLMYADTSRLAQVMENLLNNSVKYTPQGGRIWLTAEQHGQELRIAVRDTGIGIRTDTLPHIFALFAQAEGAAERAQGGLGIGLTLVKRLVEMHGGTVTAYSDGPGTGSEFVVRLPLPDVPGAEQELAKKNAHEGTPLSVRVVVADDDRDAADSLTQLLKLRGSDVRTAYDGVQAFETCAAFRPDVVLLDIGMPRLDGHETAQRIRRQSWGEDMVLIALTGWGQQKDKQKATDLGFDHHFTKPVDFRQLEAVLARLMHESP